MPEAFEPIHPNQPSIEDMFGVPAPNAEDFNTIKINFSQRIELQPTPGYEALLRDPLISEAIQELTDTVTRAAMQHWMQTLTENGHTKIGQQDLLQLTNLAVRQAMLTVAELLSVIIINQRTMPDVAGIFAEYLEQEERD